MAIGKVLASTGIVEVDTAYPSGPTWVTVGGLLSVVKESQDTREDVGGLADQLKHVKTDTQPRWRARAYLLADPATPGTRDAGQAFLNTLAQQLYSASIGRVRITRPGGLTQTFICTVDVVDPADDIDGYATWEATFWVAGPTT